MVPALALYGLLGLVGALPASDGPGCCAPACGPACAPPCGPACHGKTVCCPIEETKTVNHRCYTDCKEDFCLPCSCLGMLMHRCDCSKVRKRKYLILKIHKEEQCVKKCIPVLQEPYCGDHCGGGCHGEVIHDHLPAAGHPVMPPGTSYVIPPTGAPAPSYVTMPAGAPATSYVVPPTGAPAKVLLSRPEIIPAQPKQVETSTIVSPAVAPR
jgi:hypothetical protein